VVPNRHPEDGIRRIVAFLYSMVECEARATLKK